MLDNDFFYFDMIRKYIVAFSYIISDIGIVRRNSKGTIVKSRKCVYTYAAKTKLFYMKQRNSSLGEKVNKTYPLISFVLNSMTQDEERLSNNTDEMILSSENGVQSVIEQGMPWDFNIDCVVTAKYLEDMYQVIEQFGSIFRNDYIFTLNEVNNLGIRRNISYILNDIKLPDNFEFTDENRKLEANLNFTVKGYLYKPSKNENVIKNIELRFESDRLVNVDGRWETLVNGLEEANISYINK